MRTSSTSASATSRPGSARFVSRPSTFEVAIPAALLHDSRSVARGTETILVVEDEEAVRRLTQRILVAAGYRVLTAATGAEALHLCSGDAHVDLLITDVVLPGMNGRELRGRLHERRPGMKVLFMSGYTDDFIADRGGLEPGVPLVGKPFGADVLLQHVRAILQEAPHV